MSITTLNRLQVNTRTIRGTDDIDPKTVKIKATKKSITITSKVVGGTGKHTQIITMPVLSKARKVDVYEYDGKYYDEKNAKVYCSCSDYKFTFAPHLEANDMAAKFHEYEEPSGGGSSRPPRAVDYPGWCKHLRGVYAMMKPTKTKRIIKRK